MVSRYEFALSKLQVPAIVEVEIHDSVEVHPLTDQFRFDSSRAFRPHTEITVAQAVAHPS